MNSKRKGYTLLVLLFAVSIVSIGLMVAVPVWQTQIQREKEEELIFRGNQYVEAIRIYQIKKPGTLPSTLEELVDEKCLRRLYKDPITSHGEWNIILHYQMGPATQTRRARRSAPRPSESIFPGQRGRRKIYIVPLNALSSVNNPQIIGVVSSSDKKSFKLYMDSDSYDKWLFFHGMDSGANFDIVYYGQEEEQD